MPTRTLATNTLLSVLISVQSVQYLLLVSWRINCLNDDEEDSLAQQQLLFYERPNYSCTMSEGGKDGAKEWMRKRYWKVNF